MRLRVNRGNTVYTGRSRVGQAPTRIANPPGAIVEVSHEEGVRLARMGVAEPIDGSVVEPEPPPPPAPRRRAPSVAVPSRPSMVSEVGDMPDEAA